MKSLYQLAKGALPRLAEIPKLRTLPQCEIESCKDFSAAVRLCLKNRIFFMTDAEIAGYLGFKPPHFTKVKHGLGYLSSDQVVILQRLCSNSAITQYTEMCDKQLTEMLQEPDWEKVMLRRELAEARAQLDRRAA